MWLTTLVGEICTLGVKLKEVDILENFLNLVTDKFTCIIGRLEAIDTCRHGKRMLMVVGKAR